jgi:hypothetical protein
MMRFHLATQSIPPNEIARSEMEEALDSADLLLIESRDRIRTFGTKPLSRHLSPIQLGLWARIRYAAYLDPRSDHTRICPRSESNELSGYLCFRK